ncbi:hypothetical protein [Actinoallomurus rhizosphaericola]|uniref:hypothetical protein n=1 Tax=Actinoallomurus rhizosphaericola TaxID=2952536 RepID=UPI002092C1EB|nr:hypothetical protein [Actinoallomurus rhizosphaericola]MCO6000265.1 hypothetical protein [Actinoallomurus rhizosphaericola]
MTKLHGDLNKRIDQFLDPRVDDAMAKRNEWLTAGAESVPDGRVENSGGEKELNPGGGLSGAEVGAAAEKRALDEGLPVDEAAEWGRSFAQAHESGGHAAVAELHGDLIRRIGEFRDSRDAAQPGKMFDAEYSASRSAAAYEKLGEAWGLSPDEAARWGNKFYEAHLSGDRSLIAELQDEFGALAPNERWSFFYDVVRRSGSRPVDPSSVEGTKGEPGGSSGQPGHSSGAVSHGGSSSGRAGGGGASGEPSAAGEAVPVKGGPPTAVVDRPTASGAGNGKAQWIIDEAFKTDRPADTSHGAGEGLTSSNSATKTSNSVGAKASTGVDMSAINRSPAEVGAAAEKRALDEGLPADEAAEWGRSFAQAHESGGHAAVTELHGDLNKRIDQFLDQRVDEMTPRRDVRPGGGAEPVTGGQEEKSGVGEEVNPGSTADGERPGGADLVATHPGGDALTPRSGGGWTTHRPGALPPVTVATPAADTPGTVQNDSQAGSYGRPDDGPTPADETPSLSPVSPLSPRTSRTPLSRLSPVTPMSPAGPASRSASGGDRIVVAGRVESIDYEDHIVVDGESAPMTPDEFVAWLQERPEYEPGVPVVLLAGDASAFAFAVAPLLDAPVTGPWGDFSPIPTGDLAAGTLLRDPDDELRIGDAPHDGWYTFGPDGDLVSRVRTLPDSGAFLRDQATAERVTGRPVGIWRSTTAPQKAAESPAPTPGGEETSHGAALAGDHPSEPGPEGGHAETVSPPSVDRPEEAGTPVDRARATLDRLPTAQREGLLNRTDTIIREAITRPRTGQPRPRAPREWRLLVAAEIARSGEQAGENLAHTLVAEQPPTRSSAAEPSTQEPAASGAGGGTTRLPKGPVVEGEYHRESFTVRIPGSDQDLDPEQTARWIEGNTTYGPGRPVILNIPGVGMPGPGGGPSFADLVATHLGGTVVVPRSSGLSIGTGWTTHRPGELPASRRSDPDHAWNRLLDPAISAKRRREALGQAAKLVEDRIRQVRPRENPRGAVSRPDEIVVLVAAEYLRGPRSAGALTNLLIPEGIRPRPTVAGPAQHAEADDVAAPLTEAALASHAAERAFEQLAAGHRFAQDDPAWLEQTGERFHEAAVADTVAPDEAVATGEPGDGRVRTGLPSHAAPSAPSDLRPAGSVAASDVYPLDRARVRNWTRRVLRVAVGSVGFYRWVLPALPDDSRGFQIRATSGNGTPNDFARWVRGEGPAPTELGRMNCWEAILYTAHWSGAVDRDWLRRIHGEASEAASETYRVALNGGRDAMAAVLRGVESYGDTLMRSLTVGEPVRHRRDVRSGLVTPDLPAGHLVIINGGAHVVLALGTRDARGRHEVLSHWNFPEDEPGRRTSGPYDPPSTGSGFLQKTTLEEILTLPQFSRPRPIVSAEPAWSSGPGRGLRPTGVAEPVGGPAARVEEPASADWLARRLAAPVLHVETESFEAKADFSVAEGTPRVSGWATQIRINVQRIQAANGVWVRNHVVVVPVKPMFGVSADDVAEIQRSLNRMIDRYANQGYALPVSKEQAFFAVKLVVDPGHREAVEIRPGRTADAPGLGLGGPDARHWGTDDFTVALLHEVFHYLGLRDEYRDELSLFRRLVRSSAVRTGGIMAGGVFDPSQPMPARYLRDIESAVNASVVLRDFPLTAPGAHGFAAAVSSVGAGDAETVAAAPIYQVVNRPDEGARHPAPPAPSSGALTPKQGDSSAPPEPVTSRPVSSAEKARRLAGLSPGERMSELQFMSANDRRVLASDREFVHGLRLSLSPVEFASAVAQLMIRVPSGVEQPATARQRLHAILTRMLSHNPNVAENVITAGGKVFIIPRTASLASLGHTWRLAVEGHAIENARGLTKGTGSAAVGEENLLGEIAAVGDQWPTGLSVVTHEIAHLIHNYGLGDEDKNLIKQHYESELQKAKSGFEVQWPNGPLTTPEGGSAYNYSAKNEKEYFAELTSAYLGTNAGIDFKTRWPKNNGADWVIRYEKNIAIVDLLKRIYGPVPEGIRANPLWQTQAENRMYQAFREFGGEPGEDVVELPRDDDPWVIFGEFDPAASTFTFDGLARRSEQTARWVARNTGYKLGDSVTLVPLNAEAPGDDWMYDSWEDEVGFDDFADALATHLGGLVVVADPASSTKATHRPQFQYLSADQREALASDRDFVHRMRVSLPRAEFAAAVADLMVQMPPGVERPATAGQRLRSIITTMLSNEPEIAENVINAGGRVFIIPRAESLTSLGPWREFAGTELVEGRPADRERSIRTGTLAAVSEEDLLGGTSPFGVPSPSGYSDAVNVFAQLLHAYGLDDEKKDKIRDFYDEKLQQSNAVWPDGPLRAPNEPAKDPGDYFAALTSFYVEAHVTDSPYVVTDDGRLSGYHAARRHDKDLHELLVDIYGRNAKIAEADPPGREDDRYSDFRAFWESAEEKVESPVEAVSPESGSAANTVTRPAADVPGIVIGQPQADTGGPVARQLPAPDLEGDAEAVAAAPSYQVMNQPDEGPRHPAPPAAGGPVAVELDDSGWRKSSRSEGDCVEVVVWR